MTAICKGKYTNNEQMEYIKELFSNIGRCIEIQEKYINAVTGISGSGPAFIYLIIEALADGGVKLGLPKQIALELAAQTTPGAAKTILERDVNRIFENTIHRRTASCHGSILRAFGIKVFFDLI